MKVEQIRDLWQFSAVCEFVAFFGDALRIPELDIEIFEQQLAAETEDGQYLREVRLSLIKSLSSNRTISIDNMDDFIRRQYTYRRVYPNPLLRVERVWKETFRGSMDEESEDNESDLGEVEEIEQQTLISWLELSVAKRISVLHDLCEWQLHSEKFRDRIGANTDLQMSQWRIPSIGVDADHQIYYFLSDGRLYRCEHPAMYMQQTKASRKRKRDDTEQISRTVYEDDWTCIAATYDEWQEVVKDFSKSRHPDERQLLTYLKDVALPYVEEVEQERQARAARLQAKAEKEEAERIKELQRLEMMSSRKRSSRIQLLDEKKEAERARAEQLFREQELEAKARALALKEESGAQITTPKTREARARDRELREALLQMHRQNGGHDDDHTEMIHDASNGRAKSESQLVAMQEVNEHVANDQPRQSNGDYFASTDSVSSTIETKQESKDHFIALYNGAKTHPHGSVAATEPIDTTRSDLIWNERQAGKLVNAVPQSHLITIAGTEHNNAKDLGPHAAADAAELKVNKTDLSWVQKQADEMTRGIPNVEATTLQLPSSQDHVQSENGGARQADHVKQQSSLPPKIDTADLTWVQKQADESTRGIPEVEAAAAQLPRLAKSVASDHASNYTDRGPTQGVFQHQH